MKLGILAALAVALVPAAHAQSGCDLIDKLVAGAGSGFADIRKEEIDDGWFETDLWLANAEECSVMLEDRSTYECAWGEKLVSGADTRVTNLQNVAWRCLVDWDRESISGQQSVNNLKINRGTSYSEGAITVEVYHETYTDGTESLVWFRVIGPAAGQASAAPAPNPSAATAPPKVDTWTATPAGVNRVPPLTGVDYRYLSGAPGDGFIYFIDQSSVQRFGSRAYVWVIGTRAKPLNEAYATVTLREVACGAGAATRYIHSVPLGSNFQPVGEPMPMEGWKFDPAVGGLKAVADVACDGVSLPGPSYATAAAASANRAKAAQAK